VLSKTGLSGPAQVPAPAFFLGRGVPHRGGQAAASAKSSIRASVSSSTRVAGRFLKAFRGARAIEVQTRLQDPPPPFHRWMEFEPEMKKERLVRTAKALMKSRTIAIDGELKADRRSQILSADLRRHRGREGDPPPLQLAAAGRTGRHDAGRKEGGARSSGRDQGGRCPPSSRNKAMAQDQERHGKTAARRRRFTGTSVSPSRRRMGPGRSAPNPSGAKNVRLFKVSLSLPMKHGWSCDEPPFSLGQKNDCKYKLLQFYEEARGQPTSGATGGRQRPGSFLAPDSKKV